MMVAMETWPVINNRWKCWVAVDDIRAQRKSAAENIQSEDLTVFETI